MEHYSYKEEWYYVICRKIMKLKTIVNNNGASQAQKDQYHMLSFICGKQTIQGAGKAAETW